MPSRYGKTGSGATPKASFYGGFKGSVVRYASEGVAVREKSLNHRGHRGNPKYETLVLSRQPLPSADVSLRYP
jgi:hypothetical protein